jgi:cytochrome c oxidase subunit IV
MTRNINRIVYSVSHPQPTPVGVSHTSERPHGVHALPLWILFSTFFALIILTVLTVAVRYVDLGPANIWIALGVAAVKAALVGMYFMHLRYDSPFNGIVLLMALLFLVIFIGALLGDVREYQPRMVAPTPSNVTPR